MTTLYSLMNAEAKAWWYFRRLREWGRHAEARDSERKSMRNCISDVRSAAKSGGYMIIADEGRRFFICINEMTSISGYGPALHYVRLCEHLNVPVFDLRQYTGTKQLIWNEPSKLADRVAYYKEHLYAGQPA